MRLHETHFDIVNKFPRVYVFYQLVAIKLVTSSAVNVQANP